MAAVVLAVFAVAFAVFYAPAIRLPWMFEDHCTWHPAPFVTFDEGVAIRFSPLGRALMRSMPGPVVARLVFVTMHLANAVLLGWVVRATSAGARVALLAQCLFLVFPHHYDVVYWPTGATFYAPAAFTLLVALRAFLELVNADRPRRGILVAGVAGAFACPFFHEQGAVVVVALGAAWLALRPASPRRRWGPALVLLAGVVAVAIVAGVKLAAHARFGAELGVHPVPWHERLTNVATGLVVSLPMLVERGRDIQRHLVSSPPASWAIIVGISTLLVWTRSRRVWFNAAGAVTGIVVFSFVSGVESRYLYLPSLFVCPLLADGLDAALRATARSPLLRTLPLVALAWALASGAVFLHARLEQWRRLALAHEAGVVRMTERVLALARARPDRAPAVAALDFPQFDGESFNLAYVFRGCFLLAVRMRLPRELADSVRLSAVPTSACPSCLELEPAEDPATARFDACVGFDPAAFAPMDVACPAPRAPPVTASGYCEAGLNTLYAPARATDGATDTEWLLPDGAAGWLELNLGAPRRVERVVLRNAGNSPYFDRGTKSAQVILLAGDEEKARASVDFGDSPRAPETRVVSFSTDPVDRVRIEVVETHRLGGGFAEVTLEP